jgi:hypothetical protein
MRPAPHGATKLAVGLYRVSTAEQGHSGLGLEAQQASVRAFALTQAWTLVAEHSDIASGKDDRRPGFQHRYRSSSCCRGTAVLRLRLAVPLAGGTHRPAVSKGLG